MKLYLLSFIYYLLPYVLIGLLIRLVYSFFLIEAAGLLMSENGGKEQLAGLLVYNKVNIQRGEHSSSAFFVSFLTPRILLELPLPPNQTIPTIDRCYKILDKFLINHRFSKNIDIYPNPFTGILNINGFAGKWATFERE